MTPTRSVSVFYMWPKTTLLLKPKRLGTPVLHFVEFKFSSCFFFKANADSYKWIETLVSNSSSLGVVRNNCAIMRRTVKNIY